MSNTIDYSMVTFIIPVKVESDDRYNNAKTVLGYLNHKFKTNVFIYELYEDTPKLNFLSDFKNLNIRYKSVQAKEAFHRTRYLNEMLDLVETPYVCNYDIDVILPVTSYLESVRLLYSNLADVVYPYGLYKKDQFEIKKSSKMKKVFDGNWDLSIFKPSDLLNMDTAFGHCFFIKTAKYQRVGGENETFVSWGPEDQERYFRFTKFGLKVSHLARENKQIGVVYHLEHSRTKDSNNQNAYFITSMNECNKIETMSKSDLIFHMRTKFYYERYKNIRVDI